MRIGRHGLRIIAVIIVGGICLWGLRSIARPQLWAAVARTDWRLLTAAGIVHLTAILWARAERLRALLQPLPCQTRGAQRIELMGVFLASDAVSIVPFLFGGEALRALYLRRRHEYSLGGLGTALLLEKVIEVIGFGLLATPFLFADDWPPQLRILIAASSLVGVLGAAALGLLFVGCGRQGSRALLDPGVLGRSLVFGLLTAGFELFSIGLSLRAVGLTPSLVFCFAVLAAGSLAIMLPVTPGQLGVFEGAVVIALTALGVTREAALALGLVYHALRVLPSTGLGLVLVRWLVR